MFRGEAGVFVVQVIGERVVNDINGRIRNQFFIGCKMVGDVPQLGRIGAFLGVSTGNSRQFRKGGSGKRRKYPVIDFRDTQNTKPNFFGTMTHLFS